MPGIQRIPTATVSRLVTYLRIVSQLAAEDVAETSSEVLAREGQVSAYQVRKDLAYFGRFGKRGTGYDVETLQQELKVILGLTRPWHVAIVGMGRLGEALADYPNFGQYDFILKAAFDVDPHKIGRSVGGLVVQDVAELRATVQERDIDIGFVTVPSEAAQRAADALCAAGVRGILNFAPTVIEAAPGVHVEPVDFLAGLKRLSFYIQDPRVDEEKVDKELS